jgi:hypothetical protein
MLSMNMYINLVYYAYSKRFFTNLQFLFGQKESFHFFCGLFVDPDSI